MCLYALVTSFHSNLIRKGKYDAFKARYFVYNAAGEVKYYKTNKTQADGTLGKSLGTIETADAREVRWSMDSVLKPSQYPSPHCLEVVMTGRTWKLCPFHCAENNGSGGNFGQLLEDAKKDLARFKRIIEESHQTHKLAHSIIATSNNAQGKDRQLIAGKSSDISFVRGTGMTAYERKTGNVPPSYLSYSKFSEQIAKSTESLELMASPRTNIVHGMSVRHIRDVASSSENELEATPPPPSPGSPTVAAAASSSAEGDGYEDDMEAAAF